MSNIRKTKVIFFLFTGIAVLSIILLAFSISRRKSDTPTSVISNLNDEIVIPNNYNVKEYGNFVSEYLYIEYDFWTNKYTVYIFEKNGHTYEEVKQWFTENIERFPDMATVSDRNIEYIFIDETNRYLLEAGGD